MLDNFKIKVVHSKSHTIVPKITIGILVILGIILFIQAIMKSRKENRPLFNMGGRQFFVDNYDKLKLFGTIGLLALYVGFLKVLGFIVAGILFLSLFHILYDPKKDKKTILLNVTLGTVETLIVWFIFGYIFDITLP